MNIQHIICLLSLCCIPFDSRLTQMAPGPRGVRLWGALKPPLLIPFHHLTREALKPQGQLLPFFQTAQCGLANSQSESCLHSVTDNALALCQPIISLLGWGGEGRGRRGRRWWWWSFVNIWNNEISKVHPNNMLGKLEFLKEY